CPARTLPSGEKAAAALVGLGIIRRTGCHVSTSQIPNSVAVAISSHRPSGLNSTPVFLSSGTSSVTHFHVRASQTRTPNPKWVPVAAHRPSGLTPTDPAFLCSKGRTGPGGSFRPRPLPPPPLTP